MRDDAVRWLARAAGSLLPALFFAAEAVAAPCDGMLGDYAPILNSKINMVASVKVNGLELNEFTTLQQWRKAFGVKGVVTDSIFWDAGEDGTCTPHHEVTVSYSDKTTYLTLLDITESEFKALIDQDFTEQLVDHGVELSIDWDLEKFKDSLVVGDHAIKPNLSFEEFKKLFPFSAQHSVAVLVSLAGVHEWDAGKWDARKYDTQTYIVEVGSAGEGMGCLNHTVEFTFSKDKLSGLASRRYQEWCGGC
jgi:hypothetical protein